MTITIGGTLYSSLQLFPSFLVSSCFSRPFFNAAGVIPGDEGGGGGGAGTGR